MSLFWNVSSVLCLYFKTFTSLDSCGFEHVFVGETKSGSEIIGFHNWVQFYLQEKSTHLDYKGYKARDHDLVSAAVHQTKEMHLFLLQHFLLSLFYSYTVRFNELYNMRLQNEMQLLHTNKTKKETPPEPP